MKQKILKMNKCINCTQYPQSCDLCIKLKKYESQISNS